MSKDLMFAKIIADSVSLGGKRITTFHLHYPRFIHAEVMTHRELSRNGRSSRAVPLKTTIQEVIDTPVIPWHWHKNQPGMSGSIEWDEPINLGPTDFDFDGTAYYSDIPYSKEEAWLAARDAVVDVVEGFANAEYHKQVPNRLLEPYMWMDLLVTATNWNNMFYLRTDKGSVEPHFYDLVQLIIEALNESSPVMVKDGNWHLPYITPFEIDTYDTDTLIKISVARCARISYTPFDGNGSIERELDRYSKLIDSRPIHASPSEHQATPDDLSLNTPLWGNFKNWIQYRKTIPGEYIE
jgi:hypothetical protein